MCSDRVYCPIRKQHVSMTQNLRRRDDDLRSRHDFADLQTTPFCVWRRDFNINKFDTLSESQGGSTHLFELVLGSFISRLLVGKKHFHVVVVLVFDVLKQSLLIC